jgi:outer membrane protein assembly factor BamB
MSSTGEVNWKRRAAKVALLGAALVALGAGLARGETSLEVDGAVGVQLPAGFQYPNGVTHSAGGDLYVGSIVEGRILTRSAAGEWRIFFPGSADIYAATSLRLDETRHVLWGASPDFLVEGRPARPHRLFALDARTGETLRSLTIPDGGFGNDLALEPDGSVLVTDSRNGRLLRFSAGSGVFQTVLVDARLRGPAGIGVAGVARAADGRVALGNFGSGKLFAFEAGELREISLPRKLENPDGLAFDGSGSLLVAEGDVAGGDGKVLRVDAPFAPGVRPLDIVMDGLDSPVNLTVSPGGRVWVTEARIRHRMVSTASSGPPTTFRVLNLRLKQ